MASSTEIRKLFKAFSDNPELHAKVRAAKNPAEKHEILKNAGHTPVTHQELQTELSKAMGTGSADDKEFVGNVLHLAAAASTDFA